VTCQQSLTNPIQYILISSSIATNHVSVRAIHDRQYDCQDNFHSIEVVRIPQES
jgi:hypothetical protein